MDDIRYRIYIQDYEAPTSSPAMLIYYYLLAREEVGLKLFACQRRSWTKIHSKLKQ